jgi:hypothetical protein
MLLLSDHQWDMVHNAATGRGIVTRTAIPAGTAVADYVGMLVSLADPPSGIDEAYLMHYQGAVGIYPHTIDQPGAHMINHSCAPNCGIAP